MHKQVKLKFNLQHEHHFTTLMFVNPQNKWFNDRSRFNTDCIEPIWQVDGGIPREQKNPHPLLLNCLNPLEVAAFIAILVSMVSIWSEQFQASSSFQGLQLVLLGIFILVRKCQQKESRQFINKGRIRKKVRAQIITQILVISKCHIRYRTERTMPNQHEMASWSTRMMAFMARTNQQRMKFICQIWAR